MPDGIKHAIERKAFQTAINSVIDKSQTKEVTKVANDMIDMVEKLMKGYWEDSSFANLRSITENPDGKWAHYAQRLLRNTDRNILSTFFTNAIYEAGFNGYKVTKALSEEYKCNIPWIILFDPTSACNMHCTGCWAAEYGHQQSLSYEIMEKIVTEGEELGIYAYLFTGGEPLVRKKDIIRLCESHPHSAFHAFTNATLIDDEFCKDLLRVRNFFVSVSIEGFEEANDGRRGEGHFEAVMKAMDLMRSYKVPFGVSICYTSVNYKVVTSDEFLDMLIDKGCVFAWYFHYMPVGMNASTDLLLTPEQRSYMKERIRWIRGLDEGKELFAIDFQNDGEFVNGCVAAGKRYCHINAAGDVEPCVFIHYSSANIHDQSLLECLQQPLFLKYHDCQPFNENHLRPCPMLENPELLQQMVNETGAHSTDLEAPESVEHLCGKCVDYANNWKPVADKLWAESHPSQE